MQKAAAPFWKSKTLAQMNREEWESLCDGCGKCCVFKAQDAENARMVYLNIACGLFDSQTCRCTDYENRIPCCWTMTADLVPHMSFLPQSCAYRLLHEGRDLPAWHPLVSGDPESVHRAGVSVRGIRTENDVASPKDYARTCLEDPAIHNPVEPMMPVKGMDLQNHEKTANVPAYWRDELEPAE